MKQNVQKSLAEIKKSNADLQAFYDARNAGLSTEDAVQKIKAQIIKSYECLRKE